MISNKVAYYLIQREPKFGGHQRPRASSRCGDPHRVVLPSTKLGPNALRPVATKLGNRMVKVMPPAFANDDMFGIDDVGAEGVASR